MRVRTLVIATFAALFCLNTTSFAEIPKDLESIVFGGEKHETEFLTVNESEFESIKAMSGFPYLMWPRTESGAVAIPHDRNEAAAWLNRAAAELGYSGFEVRFNETFEWRGHQVWAFDLIRNRLKLQDARIEVHWNGERMIGILNHTPGPVRAIENVVNHPLNENWVYESQRNADRSYDLVPARVTKIRGPAGEEAISQVGNKILANRFTSSNHFEWIEPATAEFTEYVVPSGSFPDQISADGNGIIWFSQPNNNWLTEFDPVAETFLQHPTTGASGPDGMIVGTQGRIWTGMYYNGGLGVWNSVSNAFSHYNAPYGGAAMAVPVETSDGKIWVTDHQSNRISEFDPTTNTWRQSLIMPTTNCWVVQGYEDRDHGQIYFTEYFADQLGRIAVGGNQVIDIPVPGGGPAFCVYSNDKVYYSRWNESGIGAYDVNTHQIVEYQFPINNEPGGPMWVAPNGKIVIGTRNVGYIMIFDPVSQSYTAYRIPTSSSGLKDGMTVDANGIIWFTETGANKIAKLVLQPLSPKSVSER